VHLHTTLAKADNPQMNYRRLDLVGFRFWSSGGLLDQSFYSPSYHTPLTKLKIATTVTDQRFPFFKFRLKSRSRAAFGIHRPLASQILAKFDNLQLNYCALIIFYAATDSILIEFGQEW